MQSPPIIENLVRSSSARAGVSLTETRGRWAVRPAGVVVGGSARAAGAVRLPGGRYIPARCGRDRPALPRRLFAANYTDARCEADRVTPRSADAFLVGGRGGSVDGWRVDGRAGWVGGRAAGRARKSDSCQTPDYHDPVLLTIGKPIPRTGRRLTSRIDGERRPAAAGAAAAASILPARLHAAPSSRAEAASAAAAVYPAPPGRIVEGREPASQCIDCNSSSSNSSCNCSSRCSSGSGSSSSERTRRRHLWRRVGRHSWLVGGRSGGLTGRRRGVRRRADGPTG